MNYFTETAANILGNKKLRSPQIEAYIKALEHFENSNEDALIVLPTGTGNRLSQESVAAILSTIPQDYLAIAPRLQLVA